MDNSVSSRVGTAEEFGQLAGTLHESKGVDDTAEAVVRFATNAVGCDAAAIGVVHKRVALLTVATTEPGLGQLIDGSSSVPNPVQSVLTSALNVQINDTGLDQRWLVWSRQALDVGYLSLVVLPLSLGRRPGGVVILASGNTDGFHEDDVAIAHIVARHASIAVATAAREASLAEAVDARKLVGQAMGILMERYQMDGDQAFAVLRRYSQDTNTKLRDVAQHLIDVRKLPDEPKN